MSQQNSIYTPSPVLRPRHTSFGACRHLPACSDILQSPSGCIFGWNILFLLNTQHCHIYQPQFVFQCGEGFQCIFPTAFGRFCRWFWPHNDNRQAVLPFLPPCGQYEYLFLHRQPPLSTALDNQSFWPLLLHVRHL